MMVNMTVPTTAATVVQNAARKLMRPRPQPTQQLRGRGEKWGERRRERGERRSERKVKIMPRRKRMNITFEAIWIRRRMVRMSEGRVMVAPARSSERRILTGLK